MDVRSAHKFIFANNSRKNVEYCKNMRDHKNVNFLTNKINIFFGELLYKKVH